MTDQPDEQATANLTIRPVAGDNLVMRQVLLGQHPIIVVDLGLDESDGIVYTVDATGPEDVEGLAVILEGLVEVLRTGQAES